MEHGCYNVYTLDNLNPIYIFNYPELSLLDISMNRKFTFENSGEVDDNGQLQVWYKENKYSRIMTSIWCILCGFCKKPPFIITDLCIYKSSRNEWFMKTYTIDLPNENVYKLIPVNDV